LAKDADHVRVFISYANEQRELADGLAVALRKEGDSVFFDRDALIAGAEFHNKIEKEINRSDLFVFLISSESLADGTYALTELKFARQRWPNPAGHVLPVSASPLPAGTKLPSYLEVVTILRPEGNLVAELISATRKMRLRRRLLRAAAMSAAVMAVLLVGAAALKNPTPKPAPRTQTCLLKAHLALPAEQLGDVSLSSAHLSVSTSSGATNSFSFSDGGDASFQVELLPGEKWSIDLDGFPNISFSGSQLTGCPVEATTDVKGSNGAVLSLQGR
jgi:hypothetical protein